MKAYFDILWSSFQSSLKQVFIAPSSKVQNVNAGSHCNFMIFQWKPDLTFGKWSKNCNNGHTKQAPVAKNAEKYPKMAQTLHLRPGNGSPSFTPSVWPLWNAFVALWYPKLSWNVPKTLKPYISVWPKATGPCFDVLVLIWPLFLLVVTLLSLQSMLKI